MVEFVRLLERGNECVAPEPILNDGFFQPINPYPNKIFLPENVVCFYTCLIYSSELKTRLFHGSKRYEP